MTIWQLRTRPVGRSSVTVWQMELGSVQRKA